VRLAAAENPVDYFVLYDDLQPLGCYSRKSPSSLDAIKITVMRNSFPKSRAQDIGCSNSVLDGEIDSDATYRRHGVRSIPYA
jgi:hypothetical protein